jgi:hypothetical protein
MKISEGVLDDARICWMYSNSAVAEDPIFAGVSDEIITSFMFCLFRPNTEVDVYVEA